MLAMLNFFIPFSVSNMLAFMAQLFIINYKYVGYAQLFIINTIIFITYRLQIF